MSKKSIHNESASLGNLFTDNKRSPSTSFDAKVQQADTSPAGSVFPLLKTVTLLKVFHDKKEQLKADAEKERIQQDKQRKDVEDSIKNAPSSPSPAIPSPKGRKKPDEFSGVGILPKSIRSTEDIKSPRSEISSELRDKSRDAAKAAHGAPKQAKQDKTTKTPDADDESFGQAFAQNRKLGAKEFTWKGNKYTTKIKEEANVVSTGHVAGLGVGTDGEPGIPKKRKPRIADLLTFMKRK